mmetsp:Transcript_28320/g.84785  ORF Transcript_28320/g.84785 Transcript_28320/m.84785 type:complete len:987 (-) Transcript_28320:101-3061(-)
MAAAAAAGADIQSAGSAAQLPYFYSSMSRSIAEHLLVSTCESLGAEGCYLVRASETRAGAMVLSVGFQGRVHHYRIIFQHIMQTYKIEGHVDEFGTLPDLLQHASDTGKLVTPLAYPIIDDAYEVGEEEYDEHVSPDVELLVQTLERRGGAGHEFSPALEKYFREDAESDLEACRVGKLPHEMRINHLFLEASKRLVAELDIFQRRLLLIRGIFQDGGTAKGLDAGTEAPAELSSATSVESVQHKLAAGAALIADATYQTMRYFKAVAPGAAGDPGSTPDAPREVTFEVKRIDRFNRYTAGSGYLIVDVSAGQVRVGDGDKVDRTTARMFEHGEVIQLIKSRSDKTKMGIKFATAQGKWERKNYAFPDALKREYFAQLVQRMKIKHGDRDAELASKLRVFIGTFNMGDEPPPDDFSSWFNCLGMGSMTKDAVSYDLYAIGTQEQKLKEDEWHQLIRKFIGPEFEIVAKVSLQQIKLVVFIRQSLLNRISHVQTSTAATGIANTLGNKGAAAVSMYIGTTSVCFVNCHLAASVEKITKRNENYRLILQKLQLGDKKLSMFDVTNQFHHVFWFGDLNYRVNLPISTVLAELQNAEKTGGNLAAMHKADQLRQQRKKGHVLFGFHEEEITFKPTYRFKKGTRKEYAYHKKKMGGVTKLNVPSWCDRVLYRSFPNQRIQQITYGCTTDIVTSDHSPVFAGFEMDFSNQYVSALQGKDHKCQIIVTDVTATIYTPSKSNLYLEFYAAFFEGKKRSPTVATDRKPPGECPPDTTQQHWDFVAMVRPLIPDQEYLETEAMLVVVRSEDTGEALGEGRFSLFGVDGLPADAHRHFSTELSHGGLHTGFLAGKVRITGAIRSASSLYAEEEEEDGAQSVTGKEGAASAAPDVPRMRRPRAEVVQSVRISATSSRKAPALPPKLSRPGSQQESVAEIDDSVTTWLATIGLSRLETVLIEAGYDDLEFLKSDVSTDDLVEIGMSADDAEAVMQGLAQ